MRIVEGDLLNANTTFIGHQVNCKGVMGMGIAKIFKKLFPEVYTQSKSLVDRNKSLGNNTDRLLGQYQIVDVSDYGNKYFGVVNLYGEDNYKKTGLATRYDALEESLVGFVGAISRCSIDVTLGLPYKIGCGYGGGDWDKVTQILERVESLAPNLEIVLYKLK